MATNVVIGLIVIALVVIWFRQRAWASMLRWLRVLWVCRVSVASVIVGLLFFGTVTQAQDVLADTSVGIGFWIAFFVLLFFGWAFPVYYAARRILDRQEWGIPSQTDESARTAVLLDLQALYQTPIKWVPRLLGLLCFLAVAWGFWLAKENLEPSSTIPIVEKAIERLDLLFAVTWVVALLFAVLIIWRRPLMGRLGLTPASADPVGLWESGPLWLEQLFSPAYWRMSRMGTHGDFAADIIGAGYAVLLSALFIVVLIHPFLIAGWSRRALFLVFMLGAWVIGLTYLAAWSHRLRAPILLTLFFVLALVATFSPHFHDLRALEPKNGSKSEEASRKLDRQLTFTEAAERWMAANGCSRETVRDCPSPIVVAGQGGASRAAFFTASVFGAMIDRSLADPTMGDFSRQVFALTTVSGSSLAAVMIRAALEDAARNPATGALQWTSPCGPDTDYLWFGRTEPAGKAQAAPRDSWRACLQKLTAGDFLSPVFVGLAIRDLTSLRQWSKPHPWWQDRAVLLERAWENRYASLVTDAAATPRHTRGLEREFGYVKSRSRAPAAAPLLFLNGTSVETGRRIIAADVKSWECYQYPDGVVGVRTYLQEGYDLFDVIGSGTPAPVLPRDPCRPAQVASREPMVPPRPALTVAEYGHDIRLSTAATISARFPLISPSGILRNQDNNAVDRIVDGGYFENDGLATAADIIRLLIEQNLRPVLLHVTNEPIESKRRPTPPPTEAQSEGGVSGLAGQTAWRDSRPEPSPTLPDAKEITWLQSFTTPIQGLFRTRAGHGAEAASVAVRLVEDHARASFCKSLASEAGEAPPCPAHYIRVAVYDQIPGRTGKDLKLSQVSMSWWLSQPVQAYLDAHLAHPLNLCSLDTLSWHLKVKPAGSGQVPRYAVPQSCADAGEKYGL